MNPRKGNPGIVSQLQVKRLHQELASAQQKLEEYEILIASLYESLENIQSSACDKCRATFEEFAPAGFAATPTTMRRSTNRLPQPHSGTRSESVESYRSAHSHPHSPSPTSTSMEDELSHCTAIPSPSYQTPSISSHTPAPDHNGKKSIDPTAAISFSASSHDPLPLHAPVLTIRDEPDGWSITFDKRVKPLINVKLVDVLVYTEEVSCVRFSPDGYYLATGLDSGQTYIHNVKLGKRTCILAELSSTNLPPERDRVWSMSFSPDGKYIAVGHGSAIVRVWDIAKKHVRNVIRHRGGVSGVDFSSDGRFVLSAAHDCTVCSWSMRDGSGRFYSYSDSPYYSLRLTPDGRYITATNYRGELTRIHYRTGQEFGWRCHDRPATIAPMPNGMGLVTGSCDKTIKYWDRNFLEEIPEDTLEFTESLSFIGHTSEVRGVTISADGQWIISASDDLTLRVWDSRTGLLQCTMKGHESSIWWVDASPRGNYFASGGTDGRVGIWTWDPI